MDTRRKFFSKNCLNYLRQAIGLARRGCGTTSPNPMVGAVLVKGGKIIGRGYRGASRRAKARAFGKRCDTLRDARTVFHARAHAALHGSDYCGGNQTRGCRRDGPEPETSRARFYHPETRRD
jgi:hypothetical protein